MSEAVVGTAAMTVGVVAEEAETEALTGEELDLHVGVTVTAAMGRLVGDEVGTDANLDAFTD